MSRAPFDSFNLAAHVGDDLEDVTWNRAQLEQYLPSCGNPFWLEQVHGVDIVAAHDVPSGEVPVADGSWTDQRGLPLAVLTADCLPVAFVNRAETKIAIAHAGWRGLAAGILPELIAHIGNPEDLRAWIGPGIQQPSFEVGGDVVDAFVKLWGEQALACFQQDAQSKKYFADLPQLLKMNLERAGVSDISGSTLCTAAEPEKFFSYRRDGLTGRMATIVALLP